jgi:hypothetical protein
MPLRLQRTIDFYRGTVIHVDWGRVLALGLIVGALPIIWRKIRR